MIDYHNYFFEFFIKCASETCQRHFHFQLRICSNLSKKRVARLTGQNSYQVTQFLIGYKPSEQKRMVNGVFSRYRPPAARLVNWAILYFHYLYFVLLPKSDDDILMVKWIKTVSNNWQNCSYYVVLYFRSIYSGNQLHFLGGGKYLLMITMLKM